MKGDVIQYIFNWIILYWTPPTANNGCSMTEGAFFCEAIIFIIHSFRNQTFKTFV